MLRVGGTDEIGDRGIEGGGGRGEGEKTRVNCHVGNSEASRRSNGVYQAAGIWT